MNEHKAALVRAFDEINRDRFTLHVRCTDPNGASPDDVDKFEYRERPSDGEWSEWKPLRGSPHDGTRDGQRAQDLSRGAP